VLVLGTQVNMMFVMLLWAWVRCYSEHECASTPGKANSLDAHTFPPWPGNLFILPGVDARSE
jgi:hypothetical protein